MICNKRESLKTFVINNRGYGSIFDLRHVEIKLNEAEIKKYKVKEQWFTEKSDNQGDYQFEQNVENLMKLMDRDGIQYINLLIIDENMFE